MQKVKPRIVEVEPQGRCVWGAVIAISVISVILSVVLRTYTNYFSAKLVVAHIHHVGKR